MQETPNPQIYITDFFFFLLKCLFMCLTLKTKPCTLEDLNPISKEKMASKIWQVDDQNAYKSQWSPICDY